MSAVRVTAADIRNALKVRFPADSHALMWEVAPQTGGGTRYADAVAVGLWASHGHLIQGIEIKVSRADFLNEMKQPEKSEPIMRYCGRWWLACPVGMVKPEELPPTWGLLELNASGVLIAKKKAPILKPAPVDLRFFASLCRRRAGLDEEMSAAVVERIVRERVDAHKKHLDGKHAERLGYQQQRIVDAEEAINRVKEQTGIDLLGYGVEKDLLAAIGMYQTINAKAGWGSTMIQMRSSLERAAKAFAEAGVPLKDE